MELLLWPKSDSLLLEVLANDEDEIVWTALRLLNAIPQHLVRDERAFASA